MSREERRKQKEFLKSIYPDYDPKHHDAFLLKYQAETEKSQLKGYMKNRGIV